jgi:hypothetical protein
MTPLFGKEGREHQTCYVLNQQPPPTIMNPSALRGMVVAILLAAPGHYPSNISGGLSPFYPSNISEGLK